ncbi:ATP-binding protein [Actinoplanes sp. NPDC049548]|uniref:ATP-binding protein n=1 Tax=Actinoplanes sp. NPDC049548 TaxID=3155152 RepID=UPI003416C1C2
MRPPYLLHRHDPGHGDGVNVQLDPDASMVVLEVHGAWQRPLRRRASTAVVKCLSEHPGALLIDLRAMADPGGLSVPTWITARRTGQAMAPAVEVIVCLPPETTLADRLRRVGAERFLPVFPTMALARAAAAERLPMTGRLRIQLPANDSAPAVARAVVTDVCTAWRMPHLRDDACLVITELVSNAIKHAGMPASVLLSRRGRGIHLAVRDNDPRLPRPVETPAGPKQTHGLGLRLVQATAAAWGAMPTEDGKVVWAAIYSPLRGGAPS